MDIKRLEPGDVSGFENLINIFKDLFEHEDPIPDPSYLQGLLADPAFAVIVVRIEGQVVGGLTVHFLHQYYQPGQVAFVYDVGIARAYKGRGFGKALMAYAQDHCATRGCTEMFVEAEGDDVDAIEFYRKTAPAVEMQAVQFSYMLKR